MIRKNWQTAQRQATQALKAYRAAADSKRDQRDDEKRQMMMAQSFVGEALKLDKRGPWKAKKSES